MYMRVLPRDLFNEANLLKCMGQLWLCLDIGNGRVGMVPGEVEYFDIRQRESDGAIFVANLTLLIYPSPERPLGRAYYLTRPLNSRRPWPLYAEPVDANGDPVEVFDNDGKLTAEMQLIIGG